MLTTICVAISAVIFIIRLRDPRPLSTEAIHPQGVFRMRKTGQTLPYLNAIAALVVILLAITSFVSGFDDLRRFSLCYGQALISIPYIVLASALAGGLMLTAVDILAVRAWMEARAANARKDAVAPGAAPLNRSRGVSDQETEITSLPPLTKKARN